MIYIDSNIFIYALNYTSEFSDKSSRILSQVISGNVKGCTSVISVSETLSKGDSDLNFKAIKAVTNLTFVDVSLDISVYAGKLRSIYPTLKLPDALHVSTAIKANAKTFITNDKKLLNLKIIDKMTFTSIVEYQKTLR
jgi:predicted nucleic acid-binding protein